MPTSSSWGSILGVPWEGWRRGHRLSLRSNRYDAGRKPSRASVGQGVRRRAQVFRVFGRVVGFKSFAPVERQSASWPLVHGSCGLAGRRA